MWLEIPHHPDYVFNSKTYEVKSLLGKKQGRWRTGVPYILKMKRNTEGYPFYSLTEGKSVSLTTLKKLIPMQKHTYLTKPGTDLGFVQGMCAKLGLEYNRIKLIRKNKGSDSSKLRIIWYYLAKFENKHPEEIGKLFNKHRTNVIVSIKKAEAEIGIYDDCKQNLEILKGNCC